MSELQITEKLNKMTKQELFFFAMDYTNGGIYQGWSKKKMVDLFTKKILCDVRDAKLNQLFS